MSKIGKKPIAITEGVSVTENQGVVTVTGPKGTFTHVIPVMLTVVIADGQIVVSPKKETDQNMSAMFGLTRALLANMVQGVSRGFEKKLELVGVGYRVQGAGSDITLSLGFSHPVKIKAPEGISFSVADGVITVAGADKMVVGDVAAKIRSIRPPEPYKGKGIKYVGEYIRRKAGKAKAATAK